MKKNLSIFFLLLLLLSVVAFKLGTGQVMARCDDAKPDHESDLFQIDTTGTTATLYFTPVNNAISGYSIFYGYAPHDDRFAVTYPMGQYNGVISYTIGYLNPNTKYYFRVLPVNGCRSGYSSDSLSAVTDSSTYYKY